jgi:hypothetical protein
MLTEEERKQRNREKSKRYSQRHPERRKLSKLKYRQKPETKLKEEIYQRNYEKTESAKERTRRYRNSPATQVYRKQWYKDNHDHILALAKAYHARPDIRLKERRRQLTRKYGAVAFAVLERDHNKCQKCNSEEKISIHHIDADKTNNVLENLVILCNSCHIKLHNFVPRNLRRFIFDEWMKNQNGVKN